MELKKRYESASPEARKAIELMYTEKALRLSIPTDGSASPEAAKQRSAYDLYVRTALHAFPEEAVIPMLKALYLDRGVDGGVHSFLNYSLTSRTQLGAPTARALAQLHDTYEQYPERMRPEPSMDGPFVRSEITVGLGRCGAAGLEVLEAIGWQDTLEGVAAVGAVGTARARDLLIAYYGSLDPSAHGPRVRALVALCQKLYGQDDRAKAFVRRELPQYLVSDHALHAETVCNAVGAAVSTKDPHFLPALQQLRSRLQSTGFTSARDAHTLPADQVTRKEAQVQQMIAEFEKRVKSPSAAEPGNQ